MRKVLFLDIDGELNTERQHDRCVNEGIAPVDNFGYAFDPRIGITEDDAEQVISILTNVFKQWNNF